MPLPPYVKSTYILPTWFIAAVALITWPRSSLLGFSAVKLLSSTQHYRLCNEVTASSPQLIRGVVLSLKVGCLYKSPGIFQKKLVFSHFSLPLLFNLFIPLWIHRYLYFGNNPVILCIVQSVPALAAGSYFSWLLCHWNMPLSLWSYYCF